MATHDQMVSRDSPSRNKKAKIDTFSDSEMSFVRDVHAKHSCRTEVNGSIGSFEVTSTSSDGEITNGDSGFQDMNTEDAVSSMISSAEIDTADNDNPDRVNETLMMSAAECSADNNEVSNDCDIDDDDDAASDVSDLSCMSCLSDMSGHEWKPISGPIAWVHHQMCNGTDPRDILNELIPDSTLIPPHLDSLTLWRIIMNMLSEPPRRKKLPNVNTIDDVVTLIRKSHKIIVLTGAGVSVSCGIPDFRSRDGIYARLSKDFPDLPDPQAMFDINYFRKDPRPFYKFAKEIFPGQFAPSISHKFIRLIEEQNKLLRNYTQNIDTLEQGAGIERVITCHGSFATATCTRCKHKVDASVIKEDIFEQRIPNCKLCPNDAEEMAVMKPDIVFFGEGLSDEFHNAMSNDKDECDLLIVMGSSLKVRPVALIPSSIPSDIPQILINREPLNHLTFDVELLGDCDVIVQHLCDRLSGEWKSIICNNTSKSLEEIVELPKSDSMQSFDVSSEVNNNNDSAQTHSSAMPFANDSDTNQSKIISDAEKESAKEANERIHIVPDSTYGDDPEQSDALIIKRETVATKISENNFLFITPCRYIFKGAEVYESDMKSYMSKNQDDNDDDSKSSSSSSTSSSSLSSSTSTSSPSSSSSSSSPFTTDNSESPFSKGQTDDRTFISNDEKSRVSPSPMREFSIVSDDGDKKQT